MDLHHFKVKVEDGVKTILFNRPLKNNALSGEMFLEFPSLLNDAANDPSIKIVVLSGVGNYFSSGNDINNFSSRSMENSEKTENIQDVIKEGTNGFYNFIASLIDFPKPLVAVVNGPAIGVAVTMLALCDLVLASDKATFNTPFIKLGMTPEGCSSYLFPQLMGESNAAEMLLFGKKINAMEAYRRNLVTEVIPHNDLPKVWERLTHYATLPIGTMMSAKALIRRDKNILHKINKEECDQLIKQWSKEEFFEAIINFMQRTKSKL